MIEKIWKDNLEPLIEEGVEAISKEDINDAVDMMIADRIDPQVFVSNVEVLFFGSLNPFDFSGVPKRNPSPSMIYHYPGAVMSNRAPSRGVLVIPLWFYAAYPDVMAWFHKLQLELGRSAKLDDHKVIKEMMKLFRVKK